MAPTPAASEWLQRSCAASAAPPTGRFVRSSSCRTHAALTPPRRFLRSSPRRAGSGTSARARSRSPSSSSRRPRRCAPARPSLHWSHFPLELLEPFPVRCSTGGSARRALSGSSPLVGSRQVVSRCFTGAAARARQHGRRGGGLEPPASRSRRLSRRQSGPARFVTVALQIACGAGRRGEAPGGGGPGGGGGGRAGRGGPAGRVRGEGRGVSD